MSHTCGHCGKSFPSAVDLDLHRDSCVDERLACRACGDRFPAARATTDGWHYRCPNDDCDAEGLGEGLRRLRRAGLTG